MSEREPQEKKPSRPDKSKDRPANASELERAQIPRERERNSVRREQEGLKDHRMRRWVFLLVIVLALIAAAASVAIIAVALAHGDYLGAAPLAPVVGGAGWLGFHAWNRFSEAIRGPADAESRPPE